MNINSKQNKGFTLIELVLVVALVAISFGVTSDILVSLVRSYNRSQVNNEVEQTANFISQKLVNELRNANSIIIPDAGNIGEPSETLTFENKNSQTVTYQLGIGDVLLRSAVPTGDPEQFEPLVIDNAGSFDINVNCPETEGCFRLININPAVISINMQVSSSFSSGSTIQISDTIVIRESYSN